MSIVAKVLTVVGSTFVSYVVFETVFYFALCFGLPFPVHPYYNFSAWSNPNFVVADATIGYRLRPNEPNEGVRVIRGNVQFDYRNIKGNAAGFYSDHEYLPRRQRPYRIIVYGDSFTTMLHQSGTWPDHLHKVLESDGIEVYNFSFDFGAGLASWHQHYFRELLEKYEFDMVVLANCCGDLGRPFTVAETRPDGVYYGGFPRPPRDAEELDRDYRPALQFLQPLVDRSLLARLPDHFRHHAFMALPVAPYALRSLWSILGGGKASAETANRESVGLDVMLGEMLGDIRNRGKLAVLLELPWDRERRERIGKADGTLEALAKRWCAAFIDGYEIFRSDDRPGYWPRYDAHWLRPGADRFAEVLALRLVPLRAEVARAPGSSRPCH